jgi:hypothetical protein
MNTSTGALGTFPSAEYDVSINFWQVPHALTRSIRGLTSSTATAVIWRALSHLVLLILFRVNYHCRRQLLASVRSPILVHFTLQIDSPSRTRRSYIGSYARTAPIV